MAVTLAMAGALALAGSAAAANGGGPEVGPNVQVNEPQQRFPNGMTGRSTSTIAVSEDGQNMLVAWDDFQGFCSPPVAFPCTPQNPPGLSGYGYSVDGGETWVDAGAPFQIGAATTAGHPWADHNGDDNNEEFFLTNRVYSAVTGGPAGVSVHRGHFEGGAFTWDDARVINSNNPLDLYGRPAIAVAKNGSDLAYLVVSNNLGICNRQGASFGQIEAWRTWNGGATWEGPVIVGPDIAFNTDPSSPQCGAEGRLQVGTAIAAGKDAESYVIWQYGPDITLAGSPPGGAIAFSRSLDGGQTYDAPRLIAHINSMRQNPPVGYNKTRMADQGMIAVAHTGQYLGRVYVVYMDSVSPVVNPVTTQSLVSSQVYLIYSDDKGETWSAPVPLGPPLPPTGVKRFFPSVSVRPGGDVDVTFRESLETQVTANPTDIECNIFMATGQRRRGTASSLVDTYWAQSQDGGASFGEPVRVSTVTTNWCRTVFEVADFFLSNIGDYDGVATGGNRTFATWSDGRNGVPDIFFAEIKGKSR
jgi:hypothetical protein